MAETMPTVLIADDYDQSRAALRTLIERRTHMRVCAEASNGVEALEMANMYKPDLVLLDLFMPVANGIESASAIRSISPKTRVMIVTMYPDLVGKRMAKLAGVDFVIDKMKCLEGLTAALQTLFGVSKPPTIVA